MAEISNGTIAEQPGLSGILDQTSFSGSFIPEPLIGQPRHWTRWVGSLVSLGVLAVVIWEMRGIDLPALAAAIPVSATFWITFVLCYLAAPISEWAIFRRLWRIPADGFGALLAKMISNELLLGYLGEVYFYAWVRRRQDITTAPFGAIKDVTILSALAGNIMTLVMLALAFPLIRLLDLGHYGRTIYLSIGFILALSLVITVFRRRLFSLDRRDLQFVFAMHSLRLIGKTVLTAYMWHLVLPSVAIGWWLLLSTARLLISRLPFLPNKDVVFAGLAVMLIGRDAEIAGLMALMASLILATHLLLGAALGVSELIREGRRA